MQRPSLHITANRGFSLVELMIAITIGLVIIAAAGSVFLQSKANYSKNEQLARTQENGRYAIKWLQRDITMAGFISDLNSRAAVEEDNGLSSLSTNCGTTAKWFADLSNPLFLADAQNTTVSTVFPCITDSLANTDAIAIKRVADGHRRREVVDTAQKARLCRIGDPCCDVSTATFPAQCALDNKEFYIVSNGNIGLLQKGGTPAGSNTMPPVPRAFWPYLVHIYYIRTYSVTPGDNIPTLCRKILRDDTMVTECLAEGIEDLQIELGIDDPLRTSRVDYYEDNPTASEMGNARTARIHILARSLDTLPIEPDDKTYQLANHTLSDPGDQYARRVYSTLAEIRNIAPY